MAFGEGFPIDTADLGLLSVMMSELRSSSDPLLLLEVDVAPLSCFP